MPISLIAVAVTKRPMENCDLAERRPMGGREAVVPILGHIAGILPGGKDGLEWLLQSDNIQHSIYLYSARET
jgi:hypothetical protein